MRNPILLVVVAAIVVTGCGYAPPLQEVRADEGDVADARIVAQPGDWPRWRGTNQDGKSDAEDPPVEWSEKEQIVWRADVPGRGHSSPVVVGDQIFLTTADEDNEELIVLAYDRQSGKPNWQKIVHSSKLMRSHRKNSYASATPAWDGERLITVFIDSGALWLTAIDSDGKVLWQESAGPFRSEHGYGSSPALYKSLVIVCGDNAQNSFVAALDRATGKVVWRTARERPGRHGNYATPVVVEVAGRDQLLLAGHGKFTSYDPNTGELLWYCDGPAEVAACTVACNDTMVFASAGYPEKELLASTNIFSLILA